MTKSSILNNFHQSPFTYCLIFLVFGVSVIGQLNKKIFYKWILHPQSVIKDKEYYRIIAADLMNADMLHLMLNEIMLYVFCTHLEYEMRLKSPYGSWDFIAIYAASLFTGSIIIILRYFRKYDYSTTGTSGSIMGCMFSFMLLDPGYIVFDLPGVGPIKNIYGGLIYILILIGYQWKKKEDVVNNEFHFYGAIGGIIMTLILQPHIV